jgi:hypothetical protein
VRLGLIVKSLLLASAIALIGAGCGGIAATPAFSPLMLLLPGIGQTKPAAPPQKVEPMQVASTKDLAPNQLN